MFSIGGYFVYEPIKTKNNEEQRLLFTFFIDDQRYDGYFTAYSHLNSFQKFYFAACNNLKFYLKSYTLYKEIKDLKWQSSREKILKLVKEEYEFQKNDFQIESEKYRAQIYFDSIYQLIYDKKIFEMKFNIPIEKFNKKMKQNKLKITFIGCYDKGKTFFINLLENKNFSSSFDDITQGQAYFIGDSFICLDQAGIHRAVDLSQKYYQEAQKDNKKIKDFLKDKNKIDEIFIIISLTFSDVCILCCDVLTKSNQQLINVVKRHLTKINFQSGTKKQFIVLHNLKKINNLYQILQNIHQNIGMAFKTKKKHYELEDFDYENSDPAPNSFIFYQLGKYLSNYFNLFKLFKESSYFIAHYYLVSSKQKNLNTSEVDNFKKVYQNWLKGDHKKEEINEELLNFFEINNRDQQKKKMKYKNFNKISLLQHLSYQQNIESQFTDWIKEQLESELRKVIKQDKKQMFKLESEKSQENGETKLIFKVQNGEQLDLQTDVFSLDEQFEPNCWKEEEKEKARNQHLLQQLKKQIKDLEIKRIKKEFQLSGEEMQNKDENIIIDTNAKYGRFNINISKKYKDDLGCEGYFAYRCEDGDDDQKELSKKGFKAFKLTFLKDS